MRALRDPAIIVNIPKKINKYLKISRYANILNLKIKIKPAVTRVLEWTKADTGVGAAIAAGNQPLKG